MSFIYWWEYLIISLCLDCMALTIRKIIRYNIWIPSILLLKKLWMAFVLYLIQHIRIWRKFKIWKLQLKQLLSSTILTFQFRPCLSDWESIKFWDLTISLKKQIILEAGLKMNIPLKWSIMICLPNWEKYQGMNSERNMLIGWKVGSMKISWNNILKNLIPIIILWKDLDLKTDYSLNSKSILEKITHLKWYLILYSN